MTRILFEAASLDAGPSGAKTRLVRLAPALAARGHEVRVAASPDLDSGADADMPRVTVVRTQRRRGPLARFLARAWAPASDPPPDVVVSETWPAPRSRTPLIAVVHDLRHVRAGGLRGRVARAWLHDAARRVLRFHAVSEATRDELAAILPEAAGKIDVVPNAVVVAAGEAAFAPLPERVTPPFVFALGHAEGRKDWPCVAEVARGLAARGIQVVRAGRGRAGQPNVVDLGVISDATRDALFRASVAVLAPARLEGFGLVPLEALAHGAWVVASGIPAHREVLDGAADFFAVDDRVGAVGLLLAAAAASPEARAGRAVVARSRAAAYSPERAAEAFEASLRTEGS